MGRLRAIVAKLIGSLMNWREERDFDEEVQHHLELLEARFVQQGMSLDEARHAAKRAFGGVLKTKELHRRERSLAWLDRLNQEFRYARRMLMRNPSFSVVAILSLALGIAANTTIFSIINATLLGSLAVDVSRVVAISTFPLKQRNAIEFVSVPEYQNWKDHSQSFEEIGAKFISRTRNVGGEEGFPPEELEAVQLNPALLRVFGIRPALGRLFTQAEDVVGQPAPVVVISDRLWRRRFGANPDAIGKTLRLDGVVNTVIGVLPPGVGDVLLQPGADLWIPWGLSPSMVISKAGAYMVFARLKPDVSIEQVQAEMDTFARRTGEALPEYKDRGIRVQSLQRARFGDLRQLLLVLQGAVALVLLIACSNVASLVVVRASARQHEMALRSAIGASRGRLVTQALSEGLLLSVLSGIAGVLLAWGGVRLFLRVAPSSVPGLDHIGATGMDLRVLAFTAAITILTALVFAVAPAVKGFDSSGHSLIQESGVRFTTGLSRQRFRLALVAGQTALALVLLIAAGLMINSYIRLQRNPLGADPTGVLSFRYSFAEREAIEFTGRRYMGMGLWKVNPLMAQSFESIRERLRMLPGVISVAGLNVLPFRGAFKTTFRVEGKPQLSNEGRDKPSARYFAITPNYFGTMRIPVVRGRDFDDADNENARRVAIISQRTAREYWMDEDPIGKTFTLEHVPDDAPREIVGVVADTLLDPFQQQASPIVYLPHLQQTATWQGPFWGLRAGMVFVIRGSADPMSLVPSVRNAVAEVDSARPITMVQALEQSVGEQLQPTRLYVASLASFGAAAALLAAIGIYGVMAHAVTQRRREIGIRMALGAGSGRVLQLVLRQSLLAIAVGIALGLAGSAALTQLLESSLWGVSATDPWTFGIVVVVLLFVALAAILIPTRRALNVDPARTLRCD